MKEFFKNLLKGTVIGSSMLLPGVSGGTTAIILGIYDKIIAAVSSFFRHPKQNLIFLCAIIAGGLFGMLAFSKGLLYVTETYPLPMHYLFIGAILGSIPLLIKKSTIRQITPKAFFYPVIGAALVFILELLPENLFAFTELTGPADYLLLFTAGLITAVALVLPGLSVSFMLLVLGIYEPTLQAIGTMNLAFLLPLLISVCIGIVVSTKLLGTAMARHPQGTFLIIAGFVLASLKSVYPGLPTGINIPICLGTFAAGLTGIVFVSKFSD